MLDDAKDASIDNPPRGPFDDSPWYLKSLAMTTVLLLSVGSHFSSSAISALKTTVKQELGIDNTSYGLLSSSVSLLNTVLPMIGGRVLDKFGDRVSTVSATALILLGSLLTTLASQYRWFAMMVVGRLVFGLGSGVIVTIQEAILTAWFRRHLAFAIALQLASSQVSGFIGTLSANPLAQSAVGWVGVFWVAFGLCVFSAIMNFIYLTLAPQLPQEEKRAVRIAFDGMVWWIVAIEGILCMVWAAFQIIVTEYVMVKGGVEAVSAGVMASISQVVPIVLTPILGIVMDRYGRRVTFLALSVVCLELCCILLGYSNVPVVVGMLLFSVSMALGPLAMLTSLGILLSHDTIGIGLGVFKSSNSAGGTIMDILVGVVQDRTAHQGYGGVWLSFVIIAAIGGCMVVGLGWIQAHSYGNILELPAGSTSASDANANDDDDNHAITTGVNDGQSRRRQWCYVGLFTAFLLTAWILFFVFTVYGRVKPG